MWGWRFVVLLLIFVPDDFWVFFVCCFVFSCSDPLFLSFFVSSCFLFLLLLFPSSDSQIDAVDPFVDINQPPSTPSTEEGAGAAPNGMHGGIAGIIVASVFLGIGALVGLTWFGKRCFLDFLDFFGFDKR